jgi:hypothetical protein
VHEMLVLPLNREPTVPAVEDRDRAAEVVDDRAMAVLVDDVPRGHERRPELAETLEVGRLPLDGVDVGRRGRPGDSEPLEIEAHRLDHLGPVVDGNAQPVDLELGRSR